MRKYLVILHLPAALLLAGCLAGHGPRGARVGVGVVVPALPSIVVLEAEPYYHHAGYFYYYQGDRWSYSRSRSGPWVELPRDRYPREVKYKGQGEKRGRDDERGRGDERGLGDERGQGEKRGHDKEKKDRD